MASLGGAPQKSTAQFARTKPKAVRFVLIKKYGRLRAGDGFSSNSELRAALCTARVQYLAAVAASAAHQKTVRDGAMALFGLKCTFHKIFLLIVRQNHNIL